MTVPIDTAALRNFILDEIKRRSLSKREFAKLIGVSSTTIINSTSLKRRLPVPALDFLAKLAIGTSTDIRTLVAMLVPSATRSDPMRQLFAEMAANLPEADQQFLLSVLRRLGVDVSGKDQPDEGT